MTETAAARGSAGPRSPRCRRRSRARPMTARRSRPASCISASAPSTAPTRRSLSTTFWQPIPSLGDRRRQPEERRTRDALKPQDCLYTLSVRSGEGERLRVIGSVVDVIVATQERERLLAAMPIRGVRIVTLTVTERAMPRPATAPRRLPPRPPGGHRRRRSGDRSRLGDRCRQPQKSGDPRRAEAAGLALHIVGPLGRGRAAARHRQRRRRAGCNAGARAPACRHGLFGRAHRLADGDREGLLPRSGDRRAQRGRSRHHAGSQDAERARHRAGAHRRGAGATARGRHGTVHRAHLRQPSFERRGGRRILGRFAELRDADLGAWVAGEVAFPSTMVDRITPATTDEDRARVDAALGVTDAWPVVTEPFSQWVIEDRFPTGRPAFETAGAEMVADVAPYEQMKLRLLNGAHSSLSYLGYLARLRTGFRRDGAMPPMPASLPR